MADDQAPGKAESLSEHRYTGFEKKVNRWAVANRSCERFVEQLTNRTRQNSMKYRDTSTT